jgi:hypothetical protein
MDVMDGINKTMGRDKVRFAVVGYGRKWRLRQKHYPLVILPMLMKS